MQFIKRKKRYLGGHGHHDLPVIQEYRGIQVFHLSLVGRVSIFQENLLDRRGRVYLVHLVDLVIPFLRLDLERRNVTKYVSVGSTRSSMDIESLDTNHLALALLWWKILSVLPIQEDRAVQEDQVARYNLLYQVNLVFLVLLDCQADLHRKKQLLHQDLFSFYF